MKKELSGIVGDINLSSDGHSSVRVRVKGFGEVILSAPKAQLVDFVALPEDAEVIVTVSVA